MQTLRIRHDARLNVLLTEDRQRAPEYWTAQLARLLEPMGVAAYVARSGEEAMALAGEVSFHAAAIDMGTPRGRSDVWGAGSGSGDQSPAGMWLLELFRRLPNRPPVVLVRAPAFSQRQVERLLREALRLGAFSVVNQPVELEEMLSVFRRLIDRRYQGQWPGGGAWPDRGV